VKRGRESGREPYQLGIACGQGRHSGRGDGVRSARGDLPDSTRSPGAKMSEGAGSIALTDCFRKRIQIDRYRPVRWRLSELLLRGCNTLLVEPAEVERMLLPQSPLVAGERFDFAHR